MNGVQIFVGTKNGLYRYDAGSERREWRLSGPFLSGWTISALHFDPAQGGRVFAATRHLAYGPSIRVSADAGETWQELIGSPRFEEGGRFSVKRVWRIASAGSGTLLASTSDAGLFASPDGGITWHEVASLSRRLDADPRFDRKSDAPCCVAVDAGDPRLIWVGVGRSGVYRSGDGGDSWERCDRGLPPLDTVVSDPTRPGVLYAQTAAGVYTSEDGGESWISAQDGLPSRFGSCLHAAEDGSVYTVPLESKTERHVQGGRLRVFRLHRKGAGWESISQGLPAIPYYAGVPEFGLDTDGLAGIYLGTRSGEVFASRGVGEPWEQLPGRFARITVLRVRTLR